MRPSTRLLISAAALLPLAGAVATAQAEQVPGSFQVAVCGAKNPCGAKANPCAAKANPCAAKKKANPCAAKNPCGAKANPCAAKK